MHDDGYIPRCRRAKPDNAATRIRNAVKRNKANRQIIEDAKREILADCRCMCEADALQTMAELDPNAKISPEIEEAVGWLARRIANRIVKDAETI